MTNLLSIEMMEKDNLIGQFNIFGQCLWIIQCAEDKVKPLRISENHQEHSTTIDFVYICMVDNTLHDK